MLILFILSINKPITKPQFKRAILNTIWGCTGGFWDSEETEIPFHIFLTKQKPTLIFDMLVIRMPSWSVDLRFTLDLLISVTYKFNLLLLSIYNLILISLTYKLNIKFKHTGVDYCSRYPYMSTLRCPSINRL